MNSSSDNRSSRQLDFIAISKGNEVLVGASNLINSGNWNGDLIYYSNYEEIPFNDDVYISTKGLKHYLPITVCDGAFLDEKKVVVGNDCGMLSIFSIAAGDGEENDRMLFYNNICTVEHDRSILSLSISPDGKKIATGSMDRSIKIWDVEMFIPETTYSNAHAHFVTCIRYKPEIQSGDGDQSVNHILLSTSLDGYCLLWDSRQKSPAQVISKNDRCGYTSAEWFNSANNVFLGCEDGTLSLLDIRNTSSQNYQFFNKYVNRIAPLYRNNEKYVAVCADDRTLKVFQHCEDDSLKMIYSNCDHKDYIKGLGWMEHSSNFILLSSAWDSRIISHDVFKNS